MPAPKRPTVFALILLLVSGVVTACGIEEDPFACRDFCDKYRNCDPSLSDEEWDACHLDCENTGFTSRMVDCVLARPCDDGFGAIVEACWIDPIEAAIEAQNQ